MGEREVKKGAREGGGKREDEREGGKRGGR